MDKHTIIVIISCIVIVSVIGYSAFGLLNVGNLQFKWAGNEEFDLFSLVYGAKLEACNPSSLPIMFSSYEIKSIYGGDTLGTFRLEGVQIKPQSSVILQGDFDAENQKTADIMSLFLDSEIQGYEVSRVNAKKLEIVTNLETKFLGIVPYTLSNNYAGSEFFDLMNDKNQIFGC